MNRNQYCVTYISKWILRREPIHIYMPAALIVGCRNATFFSPDTPSGHLPIYYFIIHHYFRYELLSIIFPNRIRIYSLWANIQTNFLHLIRHNIGQTAAKILIKKRKHIKLAPNRETGQTTARFSEPRTITILTSESPSLVSSVQLPHHPFI